MSHWTDKWDLMNSSLGNLIIKTHESRRFLQCITIAERGYGKSMYHLQIMAYVYWHLVDKNETDAWNFALNNMFFLPSQLEDMIDYNEENNVVDKVWCLDDAAVHFSNKLWWTEQSEAILLEAVFDLIRPVVSCVLINCPDKNRLLGSLQNYMGYEETIVMGKDGGYNRLVHGIHRYRLPSGTPRWRKMWDDSFSCYVPNWVYEKYIVLRKGYIRQIRNRLRERRDSKLKKVGKIEKVEVEVESE